jgi:2-C-methyl-D-erythritol 4-phosphate cytidylyltransferase
MPDIHALIPAAGAGMRMGSKIPKQYQELAGKPLIHYAIDLLCTHPRVARVFVVLGPQDGHFRQFDWSAYRGRLEPLYCGGATRGASVRNGLTAMVDAVEPDDWVLVHDAARPCLTQALVDRLLDELSADRVGGLLAVPVADTLKRADASQRVIETVARETLWQAQTPQMFRYRLLLEAMRHADAALLTDEASAIEIMGLKPRLVTGSANNLKVTYPEDWLIAKYYLKSNSYD